MAADDLYFLAFDHRGAFARSVLDVAEPTAARGPELQITATGLESSRSSGSVPRSW